MTTAGTVPRKSFPGWVRRGSAGRSPRKPRAEPSPAVLDGLKLATRDVVLVMDADLSHPPKNPRNAGARCRGRIRDRFALRTAAPQGKTGECSVG